MGSQATHRSQPSFAVLAAFCVLTATGPSGVVLTDRGGRILAANTDGAGVKELTRAGVDPGASPDGSENAFDEKSRVYAMTADGSGPRPPGFRCSAALVA